MQEECKLNARGRHAERLEGKKNASSMLKASTLNATGMQVEKKKNAYGVQKKCKWNVKIMQVEFKKHGH